MPKIIAKKEDWIRLGYRLFSEQGAAGIVVEKMAKLLKVNKSSFYWHFKTRKEFIEQLARFWKEHETERIITLTNQQKTVSQKLETLVALIYKQDPYLDFVFYLKRYARKEKSIQAMIDGIHKKRIEYSTQLLMEMGYSQEESQLKSSILHKHFIGYHELIRYKKQDSDYLIDVKKEIGLFIEL